MKIGLVSIHSAHNYGSVLQAYALQETLKKYSSDVTIIDYRPKYFEKMYKIFSFSIYRDYKGVPSKIIHFFWRTLFLYGRIKKANVFKRFMKENYCLTQRFNDYGSLKTLSKDFDIVFVGSDQVWNTDITEGFDKAYYLGFVDDKTIKASYAASIARPEIDQKYLGEYKKYLSRFDGLSVREEAGKKELEKYLDQKIEVSIDPTLLVKKAVWDSLAAKSKLKITSKKYILTYILEDNPELTKTVNYLSEKLNLPVLSVAKIKRFKRETIFKDAGPEDFLKLFKNAEVVVTNSFHGTVFSVLYEKRNFIVPHLKTSSRMINLLKTLHLEERIIDKFDPEKIDTLLGPPDFSTVQIYLNQEVLKSYNYLSSIIKKGEKHE